MHETTQGVYDALLQGRFAFDYVHEDRLDSGHVSKYRALLLPNVAMLSDRQCQQIRDYVKSGLTGNAYIRLGAGGDWPDWLKPRLPDGGA